MRAAFDAARKIALATDFRKQCKLKQNSLKNQFTNTQEQMKQMAGGVMSAAKDMTEGKKVGGSS